MKETQVPSLGQEDPLEDEWPPTPVFLPGKPHGQKSLAGTVHGVAKESNTSEQPSSRLQSVGFQKSWTSLSILARETFITHMYLCTQVKQGWVYTKKQNGHKECINSTLTNLILPNSFSERLYQYLFDQKYKESLMLSNFYTFTNLGAIKM